MNLLNNSVSISGNVKIFPENNKEDILWEGSNAIVNTIKSLFARLLGNTIPTGDSVAAPRQLRHDCLYGVWGLAVGTGDPNWSANSQPAATPTQTSLISQVLRKPLSQVNFLDSSGNPTTSYTNTISTQTILNTATDGLTNVSIREMGLIGGGSAAVPTNMLTAPYWDPNNPVADSVTLLNYLTVPPLILPSGVNFIIQWELPL